MKRYYLDSFILTFLVYFTFDKLKLLQIENDLNSFKYPKRFKYFEPEYFKGLRGYFRINNSDDMILQAKDKRSKTDFFNGAWNICKKRIPEYDYLLYHWLINLKRTKSEFHIWWYWGRHNPIEYYGNLNKDN